MEKSSPQWLTAACGIDCAGCEIRTAPEDARAAESIVAWFREMGWLKDSEGIDEVIQRGLYCTGCRGDRCIHWSADCPILRCCIDEKGHDFCYQCAGFPCQRLRDWAAGGGRYAQALDRLHRMKAAGG